MIDHYRTLGVSPTAEDAAIRAAYLALMRRYHPDQNPDADAAEETKRVAAAYAVLSHPARRAAYDRQLAARAVPQAWAPARQAPRGRGAFAFMLVAAVGLLAFAATRPTGFSRTAAIAPRPASTDGTTANAKAACPDRADPDDVRRALFRTARREGLADPDAFRVAEASAQVQLSPIDAEGSELLGNLRCRATIALRFPDGISTAGGSHSLLADVWFHPASNSDLSLDLETDDSVSQALTTLGRTVRFAAAEPVTIEAPTQVLPIAPAPIAASERPRTPPLTRAAPEPPPRQTVQPKVARPATAPATASKEPRIDLSALERHQTILYQQSYLAADARKRALLMSSRNAFLARLGGCGSDRCRRDAYLSRNQEIVSIMRS